jgi:RHS repeat-associated protein
MSAARSREYDVPSWFPLLASGGGEASGQYIVNHQQRLKSALLDDQAQSRVRLMASLTGGSQPGTLEGNSMGAMYFPSLMKVPNAGQDFLPNPQRRVNPWDFILLLEGCLVWSMAATRRKGMTSERASFPFYCRSSFGGSTMIGPKEVEGAENSIANGELWCPTWDSPTTLPEVQRIFGEGRIQVGDRVCSRALDFALAMTGLGTDRGIQAFHRYSLLERSGSGRQTTLLAVPSGCFVPQHATGLALLTDLRDFAENVATNLTDNGQQPRRLMFIQGGRTNALTRNGDSWTLGYNAAGQITRVDDVGAGNVDYTYQYDALGRLVRSQNSGTARNFLSAPAAQRLGPGALDVAVQHLATNGANNGVLAGWVYAGENPILRFDSAGQVQYYLEDATDSVGALVNANRTIAARYEFDAFGNSLNGVQPTGPAGGDFGYHAAWRESATGLYHMRARVYDSQTGRFTSPDASQPVQQAPETYHAYAFANNNPHLFSDPTGLFSLTEINVSGAIQGMTNGIRNVAIHQVRRELTDRIQSFAVEGIIRTLQNLIPAFKNVDVDALDDLTENGFP